MPLPVSQPISVKFQKYPVLQEVVSGDVVVVDLSIVNPHSTTQKININFSSVTETWINLFQNDTIIAPGEEKTVTFAISIPENVEAGDYLIRIEVTNTKLEGYGYIVLRVKDYPDNFAAPRWFRRIGLDFVSNTSQVQIKVKNDDNFHKRVDVYEKIPKVLADNVDKVNFSTKPAQIVQADPIVMFSLNDLMPIEERKIEYTVRNVIDEYEPYVYWLIEKINLLYEWVAEKIQIENIKEDSFNPGREDNLITFDLLNTFNGPVNVTVEPWYPKGWKHQPEKIMVELPRYTREHVAFRFYVPEETKDGIYYGGLQLRYENTTVMKDLIFHVGRIQASWFFIEEKVVLVIIAIAALIMVGVRTVRTRNDTYLYKRNGHTKSLQIKEVFSKPGVEEKLLSRFREGTKGVKTPKRAETASDKVGRGAKETHKEATTKSVSEILKDLKEVFK